MNLSDPNLIGFAAPFACVTALSVVLTRGVRDLATRRGWTCRPLNHRDIHRHPIPRLGGVAIFVAFMAIALLFGLQFPGNPFFHRHEGSLFGAAALIFAVGLWDDIRGLTVVQKFAGEIAAASLLFYGGFRIMKLPLIFGSHHFGMLLAYLVTVFWVVLVTNSFNLIDGLDGLAAGAALLSLMVMFVVSLKTPHDSVSFMAVVLIGATLGFLRFNFSPASIFLGDSGSLLLGFMVSALALAGGEKSVAACVVPLVSFALPVLDTVLAVVRRYLSGKPLFSPDREHIHHKLLEKGLSQRAAAVVLYGVSAIFGVISLSLLHPTGSTIALTSAIGAVMLAAGIHRLGYYEFAELGLAARRVLAEKQTIARHVALRHAVDDLHRAGSIAEICRTLTQTCESSGFERLQVTVETDREFTSEITPMDIESPGRLSFVCTGPQYSARRDGAGSGSWTLTFDLGPAPHWRRASLTALASSADNASPLDVPLLTNEFRAALEAAVERALLRCMRTPSVSSSNAGACGQQEAAA
jgi:UDP-GlcNAc:undecaprenyl-phosphate GlcNAc-1-phosphate transferase